MNPQRIDPDILFLAYPSSIVIDGTSSEIHQRSINQEKVLLLHLHHLIRREGSTRSYIVRER